MTEKPASGSS